MNEKYTPDERNARAREFSDAAYRELRSINNLATAFFNAGMLSRGLYITDYFIHQSLERSNHTRQVMTTGEWPVLNGKPVTPRVVRQLAERYHRRWKAHAMTTTRTDLKTGVSSERREHRPKSS